MPIFATQFEEFSGFQRERKAKRFLIQMSLTEGNIPSIACKDNELYRVSQEIYYKNSIHFVTLFFLVTFAVKIMMIMATVTLTYNGRSSKARAIIDMILSTGLFTKESKPNKKTMAAIQEAKTADSLPQVDTSSIEAFIESIMQ